MPQWQDDDWVGGEFVVGFEFPAGDPQAGLSRVVSYPGFSGWWLDHQDLESRVSASEVLFDPEHEMHTTVYGEIEFGRDLPVSCRVHAFWEAYEGDRSDLTDEDLRNKAGFVDVWIKEHSLASRYKWNEQGPCPYLGDLDRVCRDLTSWVIMAEAPDLVAWEYLGNAWDSAKLTEADLLSEYVAFVLPRTHPLTARVQGEAMEKGYVLYPWRF